MPSPEVVTRTDAAERFLRGCRDGRHLPVVVAVAPEPRGKRAVDVALVVATMPGWLPLLGLLMVLVRLDSRGPAVFRQTRRGRHGTRFTMFKLRSMVVDAEDLFAGQLGGCEEKLAEWNRSAKLRDDPRLTRLGGWLRRSSLDELPQLFNVLRGDMSLVGPRPIRDAQHRAVEVAFGV
ncbi:MAG: sugar transferase, partial [Planctomycetota bacterium]